MLPLYMNFRLSIAKSIFFLYILLISLLLQLERCSVSLKYMPFQLFGQHRGRELKYKLVDYAEKNNILGWISYDQNGCLLGEAYGKKEHLLYIKNMLEIKPKNKYSYFNHHVFDEYMYMPHLDRKVKLDDFKNNVIKDKLPDVYDTTKDKLYKVYPDSHPFKKKGFNTYYYPYTT